MLIINEKKYLKRSDFIESVDSNKIWSKSLTIKEVKELLQYLENEIFNYDFDVDKNFIMNSRRKYLKSIIEERLLKNDGNINEIVLDSLFNFWELVSDEYFGNFISASMEFGISIQELKIIDDKYRQKGIICAQEKDVILGIITMIKKYIDENDV